MHISLLYDHHVLLAYAHSHICAIYSCRALNHLPSFSPSKGWLRVAIEKPFGHDYTSALSLAQDIRSALEEDEVFRIDHYLGKAGVLQIPSFLTANRALVAARRPRFIRIAMLEQEDCE